MKRINVIGTSGSGKSHFSQLLAKRLGIPHIEIDAVFWKQNWTHLDTSSFFKELKVHLEQDSYVLDGNQSRTNELKWSYVDTVIWLDFGFWVTFKRVVTRSFERAYSGQEIWCGTGNKETFRRNFFSSDSVIWWMLKNYRKTRKKYTKLFASEALTDKKTIRLCSPKEAEAFLLSQS